MDLLLAIFYGNEPSISRNRANDIGHQSLIVAGKGIIVYANTRIINAIDFAFKKHQGQNRKHSGLPYTIHLARVAERVRKVISSEIILSAAWLHDTLEDTQTTYDELCHHFGDEVAYYVQELTNPSKQHPHLSREERKALDREHIKNISYWSKTIKLADRIDNVLDFHNCLTDYPEVRHFLCKKYIPETWKLLEVLKDGHGDLVYVLKNILTNLENTNEFSGCRH